MAELRAYQYVKLRREEVLDAHLRLLDENFSECKDKMFELKGLRKAKQQVVEQNLRLANKILIDIAKLEESMLVESEEEDLPEFEEEIGVTTGRIRSEVKKKTTPTQKGKATSIKKLRDLKKSLAELKKI